MDKKIWKSMRHSFQTIILTCFRHKKRKQELHLFLQDMQSFRKMNKEDLKSEYVREQTRCEHNACKILIMGIGIIPFLYIWEIFISELLKAHSYVESAGMYSLLVIFLFVSPALLTTIFGVCTIRHIINQVRSSLRRLAMMEEALTEKV